MTYQRETDGLPFKVVPRMIPWGIYMEPVSYLKSPS